MLFIYQCVSYALLPLVCLRLLVKSRKEPAYRQHFAERFGFFGQLPKNLYWLHCISVGESLGAQSLVRHCLQQDKKVLISCTTASGRLLLQQLYAEPIKQQQLFIRYLPWDLKVIWPRLLTRIQPKQIIFFETDIWPICLQSAHKQQVQLVLANARLSEKSAKGYAKVATLFKRSINYFDLVACQFDTDSQRFQTLGLAVEKITVTGSIKADIQVTDALKNQQQALKQQLQRPIWLAASTHPHEEVAILQLHQQLLKQQPNLLLILAPRHQPRFTEVAHLIKQQGFVYSRRSQGAEVNSSDQVFLADSFAEMLHWFLLADVVLMGKSIAGQRGGHNPLEPAACNCAIISGRSVANFATIYENMQQQQAVLLLEDTQLLDGLMHLIKQPKQAQKLAVNALHFYQHQQGALQCLLRAMP